MTNIMNSIKAKYDDTTFKGERASRDVFLNSLTSKLTTNSNSFISQAFRVPSNYYLEVRYGEEIVSVMSFPYDPDSVSYNRPSPTSITYTLGGVMREANTIRRHNISMSGRSGLGSRIAYTRKGGLIYAEGEAVFQEFDEFIKRYIELCAKEYGLPNHITTSEHLFTDINKRQALGGKDQGLVMVLRCLKEDLHLKVEPVNFSWSKNVGSNRFDYRWGCDFVAYDYADRISNGVIDFLNRTKAEANALYGNVGLVTNAITNLNNDYVKRFTTSIGAFIDGAESLRSIGQTATGTYEAAKSDVVELWSKVTPVFTSEYSKENILGVLGFETGSNEITEVRTVSFSTIQNALTTPSTGRSDQEDDELGLIISQLTAVSNNVEIIRGSIDRTFFENRITKSNNQEASRVLGEFLSDERNYALISKGYNFSNVEDIVKKTGYDFYTIQKDEDLVIIANKFLGDASRWEILMRINKWRDSRRDENGDYPVPGKKILVPRSIQPITNPYGNKSDTVGFDIKMEFDDIEFTDGDIKLVNGDDNIKQYVKNTLMTKSGEIPGLKSFGLPSLPNVTNVTYGAAVVRESLLRDNRILDVYDINLTVDQDTIIVDCVVQPKNGLSIPVKTIV